MPAYFLTSSHAKAIPILDRYFQLIFVRPSTENIHYREIMSAIVRKHSSLKYDSGKRESLLLLFDELVGLRQSTHISFPFSIHIFPDVE